MDPHEKHVAVALLTRSELEGLGDSLRFVIPIEKVPDDLSKLLARIDEADEGPRGTRRG
jgi:hypothetical protein